MVNLSTIQVHASQLHKSFKNIKVAILSILLVLLVFFSMFFQNDFSTFKSYNLLEINNTSSNIVFGSNESTYVADDNGTPNIVNNTIETPINPNPNPNPNPNSYESIEIANILEDEELIDTKIPNKTYTLGPKISNWDKKRAKWLRKNPNFPNFIQPNKPRVLLISGSSPKPCENRIGDYYLLKSIKNKMDYCRIHGLEIYYNMALLDDEMSGFWVKLPLIRKLMLSHPEFEFIWWMDSDAMFTDMTFELPWERYKNVNLVLHGWKEMVYDDKNWVGLNTGSFLLRNGQWGLDLLDSWAPMGPRGSVRDEAGILLSRELKGRPVFEADDQSALVYLLATQRAKWGEKVYLENEYYLHGYWGIIVDKYEEYVRDYRPGFGDHRWPLITHFVGCKPCSKSGDYTAERCLKQMERAYNFGDNQVMEMYGFRHKSLGSTRVVKVENESRSSVKGKDVVDLLHPPFKAVKVPS